MFENRISTTKLTGSLADCMFRRINGSSYDGDVSFLATVRALLMGRIPNDEEFNMSIVSTGITSKTTETCQHEVNNLSAGKQLCVINMRYDIVSGDETAQLEKFNSITAPDGFREHADIREFFAQKMTCRAFINETAKNTCVLILNMNMRKYHLIQCILPRLLPWYFNRGRCSVQEMNLLRSLRDIYSTQYERCIEAICDTNTFRQKHATAALSSFKRRGLEQQKSRIERQIRDFNSTIERLNADIATYIRKVNDENLKLNGVLNSLNNNEDSSDDLTQFIASNRNISMVTDENNNGLCFIIRGHLDVFDAEQYRTMARSTSSWYWHSGNHHGVFATREARKKVMDAIFGLNPIFKLKTCGYFRFNLDNNDVSARSGYRFGADYSDCYPNPHLYYNSCLGSHWTPINRALGRGDLVGAISQCISSVHSVNVTESASFRHVLEDIFRNPYPILDGPNGQAYTVEQAYYYLVEQEQQSKTNEGE